MAEEKEKKKMGRPKKSIPFKTFSGYFAPELLETLKQNADDEHRSVNAQVIYILETYLKKAGYKIEGDK